MWFAINKRWLRKLIVTEQVTSHYLNQCWHPDDPVPWQTYASLDLNGLPHSLRMLLFLHDWANRTGKDIFVSMSIVQCCFSERNCSKSVNFNITSYSASNFVFCNKATSGDEADFRFELPTHVSKFIEAWYNICEYLVIIVRVATCRRFDTN